MGRVWWFTPSKRYNKTHESGTGGGPLPGPGASRDNGGNTNGRYGLCHRAGPTTGEEGVGGTSEFIADATRFIGVTRGRTHGSISRRTVWDQ